jgi:hypothetical protein
MKLAFERGYDLKLYSVTLETPQDCTDRVKNSEV